MIPLILRLDVSGRPQGWMPWEQAVVVYSKNRVSWSAGENVFRVYGGVNRASGERSFLDIHSIVAVKGRSKGSRFSAVPPLSNRELFRRDNHQCMYCGCGFKVSELTRDHIVPSSRGGADSWTNVVTACKRCNHFKGSRLLKECGLELLALPYTPNFTEYLALQNSGRILVDQMDFLKSGFSQHCRWL
ncbi:MAG: HNH endonuclease [Gammaproteobacteria bacterium]|nr:HNH endonuclease [Gammaproteobacteria bacterium]MDH5803125.1 HNH endonuclease [Gammaproteobacteria bacterium]